MLGGGVGHGLYTDDKWKERHSIVDSRCTVGVFG